MRPLMDTFSLPPGQAMLSQVCVKQIRTWQMETKRTLSYPLRLCPSTRVLATKLAHHDGISLNHFISLAVAEKISRLEHESWLEQQSKSAPPSNLVRHASFNPHGLPSRRN